MGSDGSHDTALVIDDAEGVRWLSLSRPDVLNALTLGDVRALEQAVRTADGQVSAVVLTGAGDRAFCAGMHLDEFTSAGPDDGRHLITEIGRCVGAIRRCGVPTVAMVNGYCLGVGFEIGLACDLRIAVPDAKFGLPEVKLGIPSVIEAALLPHYVGLSMAKEMLLTGGLFTVEDLAPTRLVNAVASRGDLRTQVRRAIDGVTAHTRVVVAAQKQLIETWLDTGLQAGIDASIDVFADVFASPVTTDAIARYRSGLVARH
jgi:enoyl-CoA hydratase/carnithine racemase